MVGVRLEYRDQASRAHFSRREDLLVACYPWNELPEASDRGTDEDLAKVCDTEGWESTV